MPRIELGARSYDVAVITDNHPSIGEFVSTRSAGRRLVIIADGHVHTQAHRITTELNLYGMTASSEVIPPGESTKSIATAAALWERLAERNADRQTAIVAVGGGVVSDVAGFVAATYARGLPWFVVPTSLLAMVDSAIGGKVGINLPQGKNLVGAIHQPLGVWIDLTALASLPDREIRSGLAEVVKYGAAMDADFFSWLESNSDAILARDQTTMRYVVEKCCELKAQIVSQDERELSGLRLVLNYGHTFAHAFEAAAGFQGSHGEAVAAGMVCASRLAESQSWVTSDGTQRLIQLLMKFGLPTSPPPGNVDDWVAIMRKDKKAAAGRVRFVLPRRIGHVELAESIPESDVARVLSVGN